MEDKKELLLIIYIFILGVIFSAISLLDGKVKTEDICCKGKTKLRIILEFFSHSMISGIVAVAVFAGLTEYLPEWSIYFRGSIAVLGAAISDTIIERIKGYVKYGK